MAMKPAGRFSFPQIQSWLPKLTGWFSVDAAEIAAILEQIRAELPSTEVILVGKPQTGKSSIIRAMTGVSAAIVGQGFRPHTAHTQRYAYPTDEVPLLIFTDTIGLGETASETATIIAELQSQLSTAPTAQPAAKILLLTVKVNDFAIDSLRGIVSQLRQQHPEVPCLLALTCLHEIYLPQTADHPPYPPGDPDLIRAAAEIQTGFADLSDRTVLIDFTLEEDGYTPVFYGLEALVEALSELLPEAEARLINQLLGPGEAVNRIGNLYREAGRRYILPFALMAGTVAIVPLPFATMPVLTSLQITMVTLLGKLYGQVLTPAQAGGVISAIAGGFLAQMIGQQLIKFIPGFGSVVGASWAAAYTWSLGEAACVYFGDLMGGKKPDPQEIKTVMRQAFSGAQERFKTAVWTRRPPTPQREDLTQPPT